MYIYSRSESYKTPSIALSSCHVCVYIPKQLNQPDERELLSSYTVDAAEMPEMLFK
jgi:hypothetical protein